MANTTCTAAVLAVAPCGTDFNSHTPRREQLAIFLLDLVDKNTVNDLTTYLSDNADKLAALECLGTSTLRSRQAEWVTEVDGQLTLPQLRCLESDQLEALILSLMCDLYNVIH